MVESLSPLKRWGVQARNVDADERVYVKVCTERYEMGFDPLVSQDDEGHVDPGSLSQHYPFGVDLFKGFVEKGDRAPR